MNYQRIYDSLIQRAKTREPTLSPVEHHHIIPRCLGGSDAQENIAILTTEEHYIAHQLLCKIYPDNRGLHAAAFLMCSAGNSNLQRSGNKAYGWLKKRMQELTSGENHYFNRCPEARAKNLEYMRSDRNPQRVNPRSGSNHHFFGKPLPFEFTDDALKRISDAKLGDKNPFYGKWGWRHSTCKGESYRIWLRADEILAIHLKNPTWGSSRVSGALNLDCPYRSHAVLSKIKEGWSVLD